MNCSWCYSEPDMWNPHPAHGQALHQRIAELEAEVERLRSLLQKKATPRTAAVPPSVDREDMGEWDNYHEQGA